MRRPTPIKRIMSRADSPLVTVVGEAVLKDIVKEDLSSCNLWLLTLGSLTTAAADKGLALEAECLNVIQRVVMAIISRELGIAADPAEVVEPACLLALKIGGKEMEAFERSAWNVNGERPCWVLRAKKVDENTEEEQE